MVVSAICQCPNGYSLDFAWMVLGYRIYAKLNVLPSAAPGSAIPARNIVALFSRDVFIGHKLNNTSLVQLTLVNIILGEPELNCLSPAKSLARVVASANKIFRNFET